MIKRLISTASKNIDGNGTCKQLMRVKSYILSKYLPQSTTLHVRETMPATRGHFRDTKHKIPNLFMMMQSNVDLMMFKEKTQCDLITRRLKFILFDSNSPKTACSIFKLAPFGKKILDSWTLQNHAACFFNNNKNSNVQLKFRFNKANSTV